MSMRAEHVRTARLLRDVAEYLDTTADGLEEAHMHPVRQRVEPAEVGQEIRRVRSWTARLRQAALREVALTNTPSRARPTREGASR